MPETTILELITTRRKSNTLHRFNIIHKRFDEYYSRTIEGIRLDYDSIIKKVSEDFGYTERTVKNILKGN